MAYVIADAHSDYLFSANTNAAIIDANMDNCIHMSKEGLQRGGVAYQIFATNVNPAVSDPTIAALEQLATFNNVKRSWGNIELLNTRNINSIDNSKLYAMLSIEGGEALKGSLKVLDSFIRLGVGVVTLTWNCENEIGYPSASGSRHPLKPFGKRLIRHMNERRVAVDVSHLNEAGFWEVLEISSRPVMASHSNAYSVRPHHRNLSDAQIKAIIQANGFIGLNFFTLFLTDEETSTLDDVIKHALHILELGGQDVLGFGSDFDGVNSIPGKIKGPQSYPLIVQALADAGVDEATLNKIAHANLLRYMSAVIGG